MTIREEWAQLLSSILMKIGALWEDDPKLAEQLLGVAIQMALSYRGCHDKQGDMINASMEFADTLDEEFAGLAAGIMEDAANALEMLNDRVLH